MHVDWGHFGKFLALLVRCRSARKGSPRFRKQRALPAQAPSPGTGACRPSRFSYMANAHNLLPIYRATWAWRAQAKVYLEPLRRREHRKRGRGGPSLVGLCAGVHGEVQVREEGEAGRTREEEAGTRQRDRREASREGLMEDAWRDLGLKGSMGAAFSSTRWEVRPPWGPAGLILPAIGHCLFPLFVHSRSSRFTDPNCIKEAMGAAGVDHKKIEACMEDAGGVRGGSGKGEED